MTSEDTVVVVQARGGGGLDLNGGVEEGKGNVIEVYSILEEESIRLAYTLDVECGVEEKQRFE